MNRSPLLARADLLRALALAGEDDDAARRYAGLLAYAERQPVIIFGSVVASPEVYGRLFAGLPATPTAPAPRLQAQLFAITACSRLELPAEHDDPDDQPKPQALTLAQCAPRATQGDAAPFVPLVRRTRLWPALKRSLLEARDSGIDLAGIVDTLAHARPLRRLPRGRQAIWGGELSILWDCSLHLLPYQEDFREIVTDLLRQRGAAGCTLWLVDGSPHRLCQRWPAKPALTGQARARFPDRIPTPSPATRVLILSDAGALGGGANARQVWVDFARHLTQHAAEALIWAPLAPPQIELELARRADVYCLQPGGGLRRQRGRIADEEQRASELSRLDALRERLLARMAFCLRVEPALLRALRGITPDTAAEPALEAWVWGNQPRVYDSLVSRAVAAEYVDPYRKQFAGLDAAEQVAALERALHIHAWRGRATEAAELLIWQAHARPAAQAEYAARVAEARDWFAALQARSENSPQPDPELCHYTLDLVARNGRDTDWVAANSQWLSPLWVATGEKSSPPGLKAEHLLAAIESPGGLPLHACQLGVQAEGLVLWGGVRPTGAAQSRLGSPLSVKRLLIGEPGGPTRFIDPAETLQTLASLDHFTNPAAELTITAGRHSYRVSRVDRPAWAEECGRDAYGLYADLRIPFAEAAGGRIIQRMRYIEAGHFLMGSPVSEAERYESEGPQHRVTLTQGFWLADTTCTQALWRALMGNNPSHFKDDLRKPVENVSWDDVQGFLVRLAGQLAGVAVALPTEAEWEYTCRAGSEGPFNLGATISPAQANYEGNHPYTGGEKGEYRGKTVPVKTFPPNAWGLHEMHGNVWEWCADGLRDYDSASQENPRGPEDDASRVVRGGSWDYAARRLRSAYRDSGPRDLHNDGQGFRFSLRSIDQPAGAERLDQEIRPKGFEATEWPKAGPSVSTVFPGRKDGAASADAEAAPGAFAKLRKKVGDWLKAPGKGKQGDQR